MGAKWILEELDFLQKVIRTDDVKFPALKATDERESMRWRVRGKQIRNSITASQIDSNSSALLLRAPLTYSTRIPQGEGILFSLFFAKNQKGVFLGYPGPKNSSSSRFIMQDREQGWGRWQRESKWRNRGGEERSAGAAVTKPEALCVKCRGMQMEETVSERRDEAVERGGRKSLDAQHPAFISSRLPRWDLRDTMSFLFSLCISSISDLHFRPQHAHTQKTDMQREEQMHSC